MRIIQIEQLAPIFLALLVSKVALYLSSLALLGLALLDGFELTESGLTLLGVNTVWLVLVLAGANIATQVMWRISGKPVHRSDQK